MPIHAFRRAAFIAVFCTLSACGGGGDAGICEAIGGSASGTAQTGSALSDTSKAADGDLGSAALLQPSPSGTGGGSLRATSGAQGAGGFAGVLLGKTPTGQSVQVTIRTYLNGVQQQSNTAGTFFGGNNGSACSGTCVDGSDVVYFGIAVDRNYDAIEASLQVTGGTGAVYVLELCKR